MDDLKNRLSSLEKTINNLVNNMKKIEDVKNKEDLYAFTNQQLMKWLKDNQVNYNSNIKDTLVDIVWKNMNEWEWEYYYEDEEDQEEDQEEGEDEDEEIENNKDDSLSDLSSSSDEEEEGDGKAKTFKNASMKLKK
jgi:hypothetical protein